MAHFIKLTRTPNPDLQKRGPYIEIHRFLKHQPKKNKSKTFLVPNLDIFFIQKLLQLKKKIKIADT